MFSAKPTKSQQPIKSAVIVHNPHTNLDQREFIWNSCQYRRVISIDPGEKNFAIRVEVRPVSFENDYMGPNGITPKGVVVPEIFAKMDFEFTEDERESNDSTEKDQTQKPQQNITSCDVYVNIMKFLDQYIPLFKQSHIMIIEKQLPINYRMVRVSQHVLSYFYMILKDTKYLPLILEIDPKLKTKQLKAPKGLNEKDIKIWSTEIAYEILKYRKETQSLDILDNARKRKKNGTYGKKKDDLSDTIIQIEAVFSYFSWNITSNLDKALLSNKEITTDVLNNAVLNNAVLSNCKTIYKVPEIPVSFSDAKVHQGVVENVIKIN